MAAAEKFRLEVLASYALWGTPPEVDYDHFTQLGARLFGVPICLFSIVGSDEQWIKARTGLDVCSTPRRDAFCARTLRRTTPLVVLDAAADPRFRDNPLVLGKPHIRFYAGAPLINAAGVHLGAFCVIDTEPHDGFDADQSSLLVQLAAMVMARLEQRRGVRLAHAVTGFAGASSMALVTADADGNITSWNKAAESMFGHSSKAAIGHSLEMIIPERFRSEHRSGLQRVAAGGAAKLAGKAVEVIAIRRDGTEFPIEISISAWRGATGCEFGAQIQDISDRRQREQRLEHLAHHDPLTGLANRTGFLDHLNVCLDQHVAATLLMLDLDGFKSVNDSLGHPIGDALLQAVAVRLISIAETDNLCSRVGGDEFALVLCNEQNPLHAHHMAGRLHEAFREPFLIDSHALQVGLSIGIAMAPLHTSDADELVLRADLALLAAKRAGGRRSCFFDIGMSNQLSARRAFKDELRKAAERGEWELFYQPQVCLDDGSLVGAEALLRWRHPQRGLLAPGEFLPVLETHPVAHEVGNWVVDQSCRQLAAWRRAGWHLPRISVNLFAAQFTSGMLQDVVSGALEQHALNPSDLEIEVTETVALRPDDQIHTTLRGLRDAGVHIAFDDFGTGFASLTTLKQLPASRLKIDKSFVSDICHARHSAAIVAAIVSLADRLNLEVIAEGIETDEQRAMLLRLGCRAGQGYLFAPPASAWQLPRAWKVAA